MEVDPPIYFHFSFPGGGGLFPLLLGKALALRNFLKNRVPNAQFFYSGVSSGSFVALLLALNLSEEEIDFFINKYWIQSVEKKWYLVEQFHVWYFLRRNARRIIGNDGHILLKNKYRVAISRLNSKFKFETVIIDSFQNSEDVVNAIMTSSHLPILGRQPLKLFRHYLAIDGGVTCDHITTQDLPKKYHKRTITFRIGYENFPKHLLHFQQAMPLFTKQKWERMYTEGLYCFIHHLQPKISKWLDTWFPPTIDDEKDIEISQFRPIPLPISKSIKPNLNLKGLTTGWIEILGGYTVWGLMFIYRFILNHPF
jgi:hypothetical protein